eukprot:g25709.t1
MLRERRRCEDSLSKRSLENCAPSCRGTSATPWIAGRSALFLIRAERHKEANAEMMPVIVLLILVVLLGFIAFSITVCCVDYSDEMLNYLEESRWISSNFRRQATQIRNEGRKALNLDRTKSI